MEKEVVVDWWLPKEGKWVAVLGGGAGCGLVLGIGGSVIGWDVKKGKRYYLFIRLPVN